MAPIGSGPYRLGQVGTGIDLRCDANRRTTAGKPAITQLVMPFIADGSTTIDGFHTGEVDAAFLLDASRIAELRTIPGHYCCRHAGAVSTALTFNLQIRCRRSHGTRGVGACDRSQVVDAQDSQGAYEPTPGARGLFTWAFHPHADTPTYDPSRAAALLTEDGWIRGPTAFG